MKVIETKRLDEPFITVEFTRSEAAAIARIAQSIGGLPSGPRQAFINFERLCLDHGLTCSEMPKTDGRSVYFE
jgi:hypothetical protein